MATKKIDSCNETHNYVQFHDYTIGGHTLGQIGPMAHVPPKPPTVYCTKCGKVLKLATPSHT